MKYKVVNYHITEKCNFHCKCCFREKLGNIIPTFQDAKKVVDRIEEYFKKENIINGRINLAGGEPFLVDYLIDLIIYIKQKNINVSLITNGSLITKEFLIKVKPYISLIGISIDALSNETNRKLGRFKGENIFVNYEEKSLLLNELGIPLKINICCSKINYEEDFSSLFDKIEISRLKFLQMTIIDGNNDKMKEYKLSAEEFENMTLKYKKYNVIVEPEEYILTSYLMVNFKGEFFTSNGNEYIKSTMFS